MNENDGSTARDCDPDTAPDLSEDGWPEKFAKVPLRRGRFPQARPIGGRQQAKTGRRTSPKARRSSAPVSPRSGGAEALPADRQGGRRSRDRSHPRYGCFTKVLVL